MAVLGVDAAEIVFAEDLDIPKDAPGLAVDGERPQGALLFNRRGQPNRVPLDDGGGPSGSGNWRAPDDVTAFTPLGGQANFGGVALAIRTAELRPIFGTKRRADCQQQGQSDESHGAVIRLLNWAGTKHCYLRTSKRGRARLRLATAASEVRV